jgi:hypothetical protein
MFYVGNDGWRRTCGTTNIVGLQPRECGVVSTGIKRANPGRRERKARKRRMNLVLRESKIEIQYTTVNGQNRVFFSKHVSSVGTQTEHTGPVGMIRDSWVQENHTQLSEVMHEMTI